MWHAAGEDIVRYWRRLGFDVTGIDLVARQVLNMPNSFPEKTIIFIFLYMIYGYPSGAIILIMHLIFLPALVISEQRREHEAAIRTITRSLKPGGTFVIDYLNVHYAEDHLLPGITKHYNGTTYDIEKWDDESHFYKKIKISDASLTAPLEFTEIVIKFSLGDFTDMLSYQGMQVEEVFGDYDLNGYDVRKTPRLIVIARKKDPKPADKEKRLYSDGRKTDALT